MKLWQETPEGREIWIRHFLEWDETQDREAAEIAHAEWVEEAHEEYREYLSRR